MYQGRLIVCDAPGRVKQLVEGQLIEVRPLPGEGGGAHGVGLIRRAEAAITGLPGIMEVQTYGDLVRAFVDDARDRLPQVRDALLAAGLRPEGLRQAQARMEEAFISLIRRQQEKERRR